MSYVNGLYGLELCVEKYNTDTRPIEDIMEELYEEITKDIVDDDEEYDGSSFFPYCYYYNRLLFNVHARFLLENCRDIDRQSYNVFMGRTTKQKELMSDINCLIEDIRDGLYDMKQKEDDNIFMINQIDNMIKRLECAC